jgi:hypothetical protein
MNHTPPQSDSFYSGCHGVSKIRQVWLHLKSLVSSKRFKSFARS